MSETCENSGVEYRAAAAHNEDVMDWLQGNFREVFKLPEPAIKWLCDVFHLAQVFDDFADGDKVTRKDLDQAIWTAFYGLSANPFFQANASTLLPILGTCILKWQGADSAERGNRASPKSFVWRAGFYDLVLMAVCIVHGHTVTAQSAELVMNLYGEKLEDYLREFGNA